MHSVIADKSNNTLIVLFQGEVGAHEGSKLLEKVVDRVDRLQSGFKILNDMSDLRHMSFDMCVYHKQIMDLCNKQGVHKIARVIPDEAKDIGFSIMSAFHYNKSVEIRTFSERNLAWQFLVD